MEFSKKIFWNFNSCAAFNLIYHKNRQAKRYKLNYQSCLCFFRKGFVMFLFLSGLNFPITSLSALSGSFFFSVFPSCFSITFFFFTVLCVKVEILDYLLFSLPSWMGLYLCSFMLILLTFYIFFPEFIVSFVVFVDRVNVLFFAGLRASITLIIRPFSTHFLPINTPTMNSLKSEMG